MMRKLIVSLDTEVDADSGWRVSSPPRFSSILAGIPRRLTPLFNRYGVKPTYLLSPEVIENKECVQTLRALGPETELGTHLHPDFIEPHRVLFPENMAGRTHNAIQRQYAPEIEEEKLRNLTDMFEQAFGFRPLSHRAGRYGRSDHTLRFLAALGYKVDSSVTPGIVWRYEEGTVDYREVSDEPRWVRPESGEILDLPISIRPGSFLAPLLQELPAMVGRAAGKILGSAARYEWLRPGWNSGEGMVRFVQESRRDILVLMMHSVEVIPGASPNARSEEEVDALLKSLEVLFLHCRKSGISFCPMSEAASLIAHEHGA